MHKQPLFILTICFILGIFFQEFFKISSNFIYFLVGILVSLLISVFSKSLFVIKLRAYLLGTLFFICGVFLHYSNTKKVKIQNFESKEKIIFKIQKKLNSNEKNRRYEIFAKAKNEVFRSVLSVPKSFPELDFQNYYRAEVYINQVEHPKNDYQFDYAKFLNRKGIYFQSYASGKIDFTERNDLSFLEKINQKRLSILQNIDKSKISPKSREFLKGIILADRTEMDSETVNDWSRTGLVHLLAISGSHIAIIFGIFFWIFILAFPVKFRKYAILFSLIGIWIFGIFIGMGSSVLRSCIMISAYFLYILLQRKTDLLHAMAISAFFILILDTHQVFDIGFQLSFLAVLSIYWLNPILMKYFPKFRKKHQTYLANVLTITLSAQIGTLPLLLFYFHQFSFISIIANLIIIPFSEIIIIFSLIITVLIALNLKISFLEYFYDQSILVLLRIIHWFSGFEAFFTKNISISMIEVSILFVGIYFLRFLIQKFNIKNLLNILYISLIFILVRLGLNFYENNRSEIMIHDYYKEKYFSVKEKDKVIFWVKENANTEKIQKYIIDPYITSRRVKNYQIKNFPENTKTISYKGKKYSIAEN